MGAAILTKTPVGSASRISLGLRLCSALTWFWSRRAYLTEGRRWLEEFVALGDRAKGPHLAACLTGLAGMLTAQGEHQRARDLASRQRRNMAFPCRQRQPRQGTEHIGDR